MTRPPVASGSRGERPNAGTWPTPSPARRSGWASSLALPASNSSSAIQEKRAEELLNWINVYPGEMIYVAGGTVHTLGPGAIIVETQQQSDTTYRLYDYGRPRELHLKEGLAAIKEKVGSGKVVRPAPSSLNGGANRRAPLISSPYFVVEMFELKEPHTFQTQDDTGKNSVQILVAVEGCGIVEAAGSESGYAGQRRCGGRARGGRRISGAPAVVGGVSQGIGAGRGRCQSRKRECREISDCRFQISD